MIRSFPALKHLDLKPLSDAERKEVVAVYTQAKAASKERDELEEAHRAHAISCAKALWERREKVTSSASATPLTALTVATSWGASSAKPTTLPIVPEERESKPSSREDPTVHNNKTGFSEVEVRGDYRVLVIYGDALEVLESAKVHSLVNAITFRYIHIEKVMTAATSSRSSHLKLFGRLRRLNFAHNDVHSFDQLLWLGSLGIKAEEVRGTFGPQNHRLPLRGRK